LEYIGWDAWLKRLFTSGIHGANFMFFFVFNIFTGYNLRVYLVVLLTTTSAGLVGAIQTILLFTIPALVI